MLHYTIPLYYRLVDIVLDVYPWACGLPSHLKHYPGPNILYIFICCYNHIQVVVLVPGRGRLRVLNMPDRLVSVIHHLFMLH